MRKNSFTLIEMLVVGAIFALIMVAVLGVFVSAIKSQRYNLASQQLLDETSYSMEYMSRFIRMAKKELDAGGSTACLSTDGLHYENTYGGSGLKFKNYKKECQEFYLSVGKIYQKIGNNDPLELTSGKCNVYTFKFLI